MQVPTKLVLSESSAINYLALCLEASPIFIVEVKIGRNSSSWVSFRFFENEA